MPDARIITVAEAVKTRINSVWAPSAPDTVERAYRYKPSDKELSSLTGRHVRVYPSQYGDELETRGEDRHQFRIAIVAVERYTDAGLPSNAWMDARVYWAEQKIADALDYDGRVSSSGFLTAGSMKLLTESIEVAVYDVEYQESLHLFWSEFEIVFTAVF